MTMLIHLFNLLCWYMVVPFFGFIFSLVFGFSFYGFTQNAPFAILYVIYLIVISGAYSAMSDERDSSMMFIK